MENLAQNAKYFLMDVVAPDLMLGYNEYRNSSNMNDNQHNSNNNNNDNDNDNDHTQNPYVYQQTTTWNRMFGSIIPFIKQTIYLGFLTFGLFISSCVIYTIIYWIVIPQSFTTKTIYFNYNNLDCHQKERIHYNKNPKRFKTSSTPADINTFDETKLTNTIISPEGGILSSIHSESIKRESENKTENENETHQAYNQHQSIDTLYQQLLKKPCPPSATIELLTPYTQWKAHYNKVAPSQQQPQKPSHKFTQQIIHSNYTGILQPNHSYFIQLALTLPESQMNRNIGMFMIEIDLRDMDGNRLASSSRPSMLPFESTYVSTVRKSLLMGPLVLGAIPEARIVVVDCFDHFIESLDRPLASADIRLIIPQSSDSSIQIHYAELRIGKELNTIQSIMKKWFYTTAIITIIILMIFQAIGFYILQAWLDLQYTKHMKSRGNQYQQQHHTHFHEYNTNFDSTPNLNANEQDYEQFFFDDNASNDVWEDMHYDDVDDPTTPDIVGDIEILSETKSEHHVSDNSNTTHENNENETVETISHNKMDTMNRSMNKEEVKSETNTLNNDNDTKKKKRKKSKKKKTISNDKSEIKQSLSRQEEERIKLDKVMKGDYGPYEIFTDIDDPDCGDYL